MRWIGNTSKVTFDLENRKYPNRIMGPAKPCASYTTAQLEDLLIVGIYETDELPKPPQPKRRKTRMHVFISAIFFILFVLIMLFFWRQ